MISRIQKFAESLGELSVDFESIRLEPYIRSNKDPNAGFYARL